MTKTEPQPDGTLNPNNVRERLGSRIRHLRKARGWTLADLAQRADVQIADLSKWETGKRGPNVESLIKLADGLGVPPAELFELTDPPARPELDRIIALLLNSSDETLRLARRIVEVLVHPEAH
ncbi:MAG: helix-turn-helix transcriptional regulator [Alphaproteobacteria bacterium]|nr:helix-turn-helix transcriptional regulator [Alphaproteobacteria bacterium]